MTTDTRKLFDESSICASPPTAYRTVDVVNSAAARQASDHLPLVCDLRLPC